MFQHQINSENNQCTGMQQEDNSPDFLTDDEDEGTITPKEIKEDNRLLKKEVRKLKGTNEILEAEVKTLNDKVKVFAENLSSIEEKHHREMKVHKEAGEFKLEQKLALENQLKLYIDQQERVIQDMQQKNGEDVLFNFSNSVNMFVTQVNELHDKMGKLQEENCHLTAKNVELGLDIAKLNNLVENSFVSKEDYDLLLKEKEILSRTPRKPLGSLPLTPNKSIVDRLNDDGIALRKHQTELEKKNRGLRKKVMELESKCTTLMYAPPKVQVREIVDENLEKELSELKDERFRLNLELSKSQYDHATEIKSLKDTISVLEMKVTRLNEEADVNVQECRDVVANIREMRKNVETEKKRNQQLQEQLSHTDLVHSLKIKEIESLEETKRNILNTRYNTLQCKYDHLTRLVNAVKDVPKILNEIREYKCVIDKQLRFFNQTVALSLASFKDSILEKVADTDYRSSLLAVRYQKEVERRKQLHNKLVELKGNIRVLCRVRPVIKEDGGDCQQVISFDSEEDDVLFVKSKGSNKAFHMDKVFKPSSTQTEVFKDVESLVTSCLDGYNVCIFAYGQTGAGKTFTMEGTKENPGLNQQALKHLFRCTSEMRDWEFTIHVSFMEIYNEMLCDLLSADPTAKLSIKQNTDNSLYVPDLEHVQVRNVSDVNEVFSTGSANRKTASTNMNEASSRSHSVLCIDVAGKNIMTRTKVNGKLNLVDLAGSERVSKSGSDGQRMKEAQNINKSLSALGDVIHSLKNKNAHVPFRNSKLTYLLQDSLGGDSKTLMVVQVSPVDKNTNETICSLNFAQRVRQVELGMATRKEQSCHR